MGCQKVREGMKTVKACCRDPDHEYLLPRYPGRDISVFLIIKHPGKLATLTVFWCAVRRHRLHSCWVLGAWLLGTDLACTVCLVSNPNHTPLEPSEPPLCSLISKLGLNAHEALTPHLLPWILVPFYFRPLGTSYDRNPNVFVTWD